MAYETITVDVEDHISIIKLNRPDALNALNQQLLGELMDAFEAADANDSVRCIVLTGSDKAFVAGARSHVASMVPPNVLLPVLVRGTLLPTDRIGEVPHLFQTRVRLVTQLSYARVAIVNLKKLFFLDGSEI